MLPIDGFWFDDSWVVAGEVFGDPSQILSVGSTHPTFTLSLMGIARLGGGNQAFVVPALVAGVLAPALLFALARRCGLGAGPAGLAAAALATAEILVTYAGRAKPYTIDAIERAGVHAVVSGDASCLMQIGGRLSRKGSKVKVMHLAELLNESSQQ